MMTVVCIYDFSQFFRLFTTATFLGFLGFGILIGTETPDMQANLPTPYISLWERINIAAFNLWVVVFAIALLHKKNVRD